MINLSGKQANVRAEDFPALAEFSTCYFYGVFRDFLQSLKAAAGIVTHSWPLALYSSLFQSVMHRLSYRLTVAYVTLFTDSFVNENKEVSLSLFAPCECVV